MHSYADTEYESGGVYREYVQAREMKIEHFRQRLLSIGGRIGKGKLLDVGCSCGYFMEVAATEGYDVAGLEFSENAVAAAAEHIRPRILNASVEQISAEQKSSYDVVSAFDIIEHLEQPLTFLAHVRSVLKPGGRLVIATPDAGHWLRYLMGARWPMLQPMQHLSLFSAKSMQLALQNAGFAKIVVEPAYKVISGTYLIRQLSAPNPMLYRVLSGTSRVMPRAAMNTWRKVNIGEILAIAERAD
jgi:2-polyprenyl-3-methyl-5-hydroxy-6-metoxy-1,4-benzoquinol methylase